MFDLKLVPWWKMSWPEISQNFAIIYYSSNLFLHFLIPTGLLIYLLFTKFYFLTLIYISWYVYDFQTPFRGGGRKWNWYRNLMGSNVTSYFPVTMVKTAELPVDRNYVFGCHPHGFGAYSWFCVFGSDGTGFSKAFPGLNINVITMRYFFLTPIQREFINFLGACPASPESIDYILSPAGGGPGRGVAIVVGGAREMIITRQKRMKLFLKNRKGFVRMALRHGASLVPVLSFGENDLYDAYPKNPGDWYEKFQDWIWETLNIPIFILNGRGLFQKWFGLIPNQKPITVIVGKPVDAPGKIPEPTKEQIDDFHRRYIEELSRMYDEHKNKYGYGDVPLELK